VDAFDTVLVAGLGPVGLGSLINGVYRGARVIGLEGNPYRANLARELGATAVIDPADPDGIARIRAMTGGRGADKAVDCTGQPAAQKAVIEATRRRGQVAFVGWGGHIEIDNMVPQGLSLHGVWHWNLHDASRMMKMLADCRAPIARLITHTFPMSRVREALELQLTGQCGKVVLHPWE